ESIPTLEEMTDAAYMEDGNKPLDSGLSRKGFTKTDSEVTKDYQYEEIRAQRQMEEIRLKMTYEAAQSLEKRGFSIETQQLEKVVEALKELEESYYKKMLYE